MDRPVRPVILSISRNAHGYLSVIVSVAPGRRVSATLSLQVEAGEAAERAALDIIETLFT